MKPEPASTPGMDLSLPSTPASVARARRAALQVVGAEDTDLAADVSLVVSELVTNAILHAAPPLLLSVGAVRDGIRVTVSDGGPLFDPNDDYPDPHRGLRIVREITGGLELVPTPGGKSVGALVPQATPNSGPKGSTTT